MSEPLRVAYADPPYPGCAHLYHRARVAAHTWVAMVNAALPPYRRERERDPDEARLLRERGTPEELIGPESTTRRVLVREADHTVMWVPTKSAAKSFTAQLLRAGKKFTCEPCTDEGWEITVDETNHPNKWEAGL